jgi:hypothetical protein
MGNEQNLLAIESKIHRQLMKEMEESFTEHKY